ncbi:MAG: disulfide bond formation protein B [Rhodospirillaceae bacterium]|jgi:disulfide bond formation protein DsbB|nr:disulfide bond formation protein B [Rhodospirillaceae bacterium]
MSFEPAPTRLQRTYPWFLAMVGVGALVMAYTAQYGFGLEPCNLCLLQRIPYVLIAVVGWMGIKHPQWVSPGNLTAIAGIIFFAGAVLAVYHVGVEQHLWQSAAGCGGEAGAQISVNQFQQMLQEKPPKSCDEVDWTLFGVSMATHNAFFSFVMAGISFNAARRIWITS